MLISYSHNFIFIHVYKVAGSSITRALKDYAQQEAKLPMSYRLHYFINFGLYYFFMRRILRRKVKITHTEAKKLKRMLPAHIYNNFFKFAFVRNPWDWQVSLYFYMLDNKKHPQHQIIKSMSSFDEYIKWRVSQDKQLQKSFVTDDDGNLIVDFIGKYENIEADFASVCDKIGVKASLPHVNKSPHEHYKKYYNERTINLVYEAFKEDIEFFNYSF